MIFIYSSYSKFTNWPDNVSFSSFPSGTGSVWFSAHSYLDIAFNYHDFKRFSRLSLLFTVPRFLKSAGQYFVKFPSIWFCFMFSYDQAYFFFFFFWQGHEYCLWDILSSYLTWEETWYHLILSLMVFTLISWLEVSPWVSLM